MINLYHVLSGCPGCRRKVTHIGVSKGPVDSIHEILIEADYCPRCGVEVGPVGGWNRLEKSEVERVESTQISEVDGLLVEEAQRRLMKHRNAGGIDLDPIMSDARVRNIPESTDE
jgi:hypothetical protein